MIGAGWPGGACFLEGPGLSGVTDGQEAIPISLRVLLLAPNYARLLFWCLCSAY